MRVKQAQFILIAGTVAAIVLASCSTATGPSPTAGTAGAETKPYGSLTVVGQFGTGQLDPQTGSAAAFTGLGQAIMDTLVSLGPKELPVPGIAERWDISPDGKTHTFYIRKGVKFHDGSDLTAADVKFSIERMIAPETTTNSDAANWRAVVEAVEQKDDYTALLRLKQPRFELLPGIESGMGAVVPKRYIEEKGVENFRKNPIGSGPWKFVSWEPGTKLVLEAVDSHWRAVPKFKDLTLVKITESATQVATLRTGEIDMSPVGTDAVTGLKAAGVRILGTPEGRGIRYNTWTWYDLEHPDTSPFGDVRVRKALQLAINAKELADKLFQGNGRPYALHGARPTEPYFDPNKIKVDPFDPEGAKKLLVEAGYPGGFSTKLWDVGGGGEQTAVNLAIAGYWEKIGVKTQIAPIDYAAFRAKYQPKVVPELWNTAYTLRATAGFASFAQAFPVYYHSQKSAPKNLKDPKLDQLIDAALAAKDLQERLGLQLEAAVRAKEGYSSLAVVEIQGLLGVGAKVGEVGLVDFNVDSTPALVYETIAHAK